MDSYIPLPLILFTLYIKIGDKKTMGGNCSTGYSFDYLGVSRKGGILLSTNLAWTSVRLFRTKTTEEQDAQEKFSLHLLRKNTRFHFRSFC